MSERLSVFREVAAGAATGCVTLPLSVAAGILVYSQFGAEYVAIGAVAGLITAVLGGATASILHGSLLVKSLPTKSALIQSSIAGGMVASLGDVHLALVVFPFCIMLAGLWQIGMALSGLSKVVNMTPYPVVAGFVSGVGLLIILGQLPTLLGVQSVIDITGVGDLSLSRLLFGAGVVAAMFALGRVAPRVPAPIVGLVVGHATYQLIGFFAAGVDLGPVVGAVDISLWAPFDFADLVTHMARRDAANFWFILLGGSLVLALAGTLDTAVAIESLRHMAGVSTDQKRDLVGQGVASVVTAATGGLFVTISLALTAANYHAGGRTRWSTLVGAVFLLFGVVLFPQIVFSLPLVVLSAILVYVGFRLIDRWVIDGCYEAIFSGASPNRRQVRRNAAIAIVVMSVTVLGRPLLGAAAGAALACAVFIAQMNRPAVSQRVAAERLSSKRKRSHVHQEWLAENSSRLAVLRLQGVLFFANAHDVRIEIDTLPDAVETLILDFRDVTDIDISGAVALRQACVRLRRHHRRVFFCGLRLPHVEVAIRDMATESEIFADLDAALERFEDETLRQHQGGPGSTPEVKLADSDFGRHLKTDDLSILKRHMRLAVFPAGDDLCRAGDPSDRLWVLTRGSVSVAAATETGRRRLASIGPGCVVGEMGLLEERQRSADVIADEEVHTYELTAGAFRTILSEHPQLGQAVLQAIACELSERLRFTSEELQRADR